MLEMKIKIEADAAVLKAIDKLTTALEKNAVNISVPQDTPAPVAPWLLWPPLSPMPRCRRSPCRPLPWSLPSPPLRLWQPLPLHRLLRHLPRLWPLLTPLPLFP